MNPEWEEGSENIFKDLGFSEAEAEHLMIRSRLMIEVEKFVERSKLSQREAAKMLGITQPRLNDLLQGKIQKFSIDALVKMLAKVGIHVDVHVSAA
ncbi:MAG: helix-turn-helix transcriptional regulator [Nitrospiraceae bacterium]|jgi:predicted XRE-type DNA-binding protein|nr:helix-turn-helix transcriptional regulator [Nitrospiraceae bacterium]